VTPEEVPVAPVGPAAPVAPGGPRAPCIHGMPLQHCCGVAHEDRM
jgi:hypothetical protein